MTSIITAARAAVMLLPTYLEAQQVPARFVVLDRELRDAAVKPGAPAVAVAIAHHGRIVWEAGYGRSGIADDARMTANTPVESCSRSDSLSPVMRFPAAW